MSQAPSYLDYVKEAFNASPRVPGLGGLPVNWMGLAAFATLGLLHPGLWLVGAGLEIAYLASLSNSPRFQNYVRGKRRAAARRARTHAAAGDEADRLAGLDESEQDRYGALVARIAEVPRTGEGANALIADVAHEGLEVLRSTFLDVLVASSRLSASSDPNRRKSLSDELLREERALTSLGPDADPRIRKSREGTIDILRKRLAHIDEAARDREFLLSELRRIEQQVGLVIDEASLADDPESLTERIDHVTNTFGETREWMRLHKELLDEPSASTPTKARPPRLPESR